MPKLSTEFKLLVLCMLVCIAIIGFSINQYDISKQVERHDRMLNELNIRIDNPVASPSPTLVPTASPTASLKRLPTVRVTVEPTKAE